MAKNEKTDMAKNEKTEPVTKMIFVKCERVHTYGNGLAGIEVEAQLLGPEIRATIKELFPNTQEQVYDLLDREALLGAMSSIEADFQSDEHKTHETGAKPPSPWGPEYR